MFYLVFNNLEKRVEFTRLLKEHNIYAVFHYLSLHKSPYYLSRYQASELTETDRYTDCLLRLPMYYELDVLKVIEVINKIVDSLT
jgi:dTDP-4-amino-4,6-dideoxygalactose transaminase